MKLSEISIKRPVLASMMSLGLILFGIIGLNRLPVRELPDIDPPIVNVTTVYPGASASVVETQVTEILEESIISVEGIRILSSESRQQVSTITVEFDLSRSVDIAAQDVRDRVSRVRGNLPKDIEEPIVAKQDSNAQPVLWIALFSDRYSTLELTTIAESTFKDRLQTINGVSSVILGGAKRFAIRIWLDAQKMAARGITVLDVEIALKTQNIELPSGLVENWSRVMSIETQGEMKTPEEYNNLVIKQNGATFIRLSDIGRAVIGVEDEKAVARFNSKPALGIGIVRQSKANTIEVTRRVKEEVAKIVPTLPKGIETAFPYDESIYVDRAIHEVWETLFLAFGLVVLSIYIFLHDGRSTLIPTLTIPVSIISTFGVLYMMGYSINIVSMLAFVLAIGLVVDDSIIVLENIYRHIEEGMTPLQAAFKGMQEIGFVVITTTIALVAVFLPMAFQTSVTGRLFVEFAVALCMSVVISAFVALTLSPMLSSRILKPIQHAKKGSLLGAFERYLERLTVRYGKSLEWALARPKRVLSVVVVTVVLTGVLFMHLEKEFLPDEDKGRLLCFALAPEGSTSEYTDRMVRKMEAIIKDVPEVEGYFTAVALSRGGPGQTSQGLAFIRLKDDRKRHLRDIIGGPKGLGARFFNEVEGAFVIPIVPKAIGRGFTQPFQLVIQGQDLGELNKYAEQLTNELRLAGFLMNVRTTFEMNKPELRINVDRDRAAVVGVNVEDISRTMQILFGGLDLSKVNIKGKEYDVIVQLDRESRLTPSDLEKVYIRNFRGELVQLNNVITYEAGAGPSAINHYNRWRSATIEGTPMGMPLGTVMDKTNEIVKKSLPDGFKYEWSGDARDLTESSKGIYFVMILAMLVIYMVLAAQFESLIHPLTVMFTLPLAAFGALSGLWFINMISATGWFGVIQGMNINLYSQIGIILLFGLVTKNGIILVDFANQQVAQGKSARDAMIAAGLIRLRPILMTATATIVGIMPIAIGFGASGEARRPLGVAAVFGMFTSTFLTLFVIPVVYVFFSNLFKGRKKKEPALDLHKPIVSILLVGAFMMSFTGCSVGPKYVKPKTEYKDSWKNSSPTTTIKLPSQWWMLFNDSALNELQEKALRGNQDLVIAMANVDRARAIARVEGSSLLPTIDANPSFERSRTAATSNFPSRTLNLYQLPLDLSYEIDIWGKVRRAFAAGRADAQAQTAAYGTVYLTLTGDVARHYFQIAAADAEIEALQKAVELRQRAVGLLKLRFQEGMNSELTYFQAQTQLSQAQADLIDARRRRENLVNVLAVLCGQNANDFQLPNLTLKDWTPEIPAKLPSSILMDRPDIVEAERLLSAASERVGVAQAAFFPAITLTGSAGYASIEADDLLNWESRVWSVGPSVNLPIFNGGRLNAKMKAQQAEFKKSQAEYKKRVLTAFSEVENALADIRLRKEEFTAQSELRHAAQQAADLSLQRYKEGLVSFLEVIDAERSRLESERDAIAIQSETMISAVQLIKAIGGGWAENQMRIKN